MTSSPSEDVQIAGMRIALQYFLDLQRQAVHPTPHVGVADCQPNAHPRRDRDHRPDSALTQHRRRSGPVMTSTLAIAPSLTPVQPPSLAPLLTTPTPLRAARPP